ncbi:HAD-like domain-containing protein [Gloeopeniophorella convolvens]|nr:HAD-like domain-containing protein [Gloeopeniophorella convolvens]
MQTTQPIIAVSAPTPTVGAKESIHSRIYRTSTFLADAALFDMDGTLTDSIAAVEAAWSKVAQEIGEDPAFVIAATHGKRAIDNLTHFKPHLLAHELDAAVDEFESSILFYADAHSHARAARGSSTPSLTSGSSSSSGSEGPSLMASAAVSSEQLVSEPMVELAEELAQALSAERDGAAEWELEAASVDRAVRILPGVKALIEAIPKGRYAVATSGAKTYAHGCMSRVGITPPDVTITADDRRLKAGKPAPDPFLLAAECLGYTASRCVVFEDSPSGIKAGVASGAIVIAVCTSHAREQIEECGAHFVVDTLEDVGCEVVETDEGSRLMFTVDY